MRKLTSVGKIINILALLAAVSAIILFLLEHKFQTALWAGISTLWIANTIKKEQQLQQVIKILEEVEKY
ncbi:hypothetical protein [Lactococcus allomyrinae]|uniref:Uncharacterized protein n=1 Tax=Lactococcus allomyrinae TaxID=2419773 RepID=A0A387BMQ4_9LACT|nr:hypothetical protein [Lactococcus allomyrinae]AYF99810.1 hypothetical protein D7I46_01145 [Lactococcus allomyrinae]